jgi:hypothetical protein
MTEQEYINLTALERLRIVQSILRGVTAVEDRLVEKGDFSYVEHLVGEWIVALEETIETS